MTPLHVVGQSGDKEMATFLFENGKCNPCHGLLLCIALDDIVAREPYNKYMYIYMIRIFSLCHTIQYGIVLLYVYSVWWLVTLSQTLFDVVLVCFHCQVIAARLIFI